MVFSIFDFRYIQLSKFKLSVSRQLIGSASLCDVPRFNHTHTRAWTVVYVGGGSQPSQNQSVRQRGREAFSRTTPGPVCCPKPVSQTDSRSSVMKGGEIHLIKGVYFARPRGTNTTCRFRWCGGLLS